jgi:hypothetical protein
MFDSMRLGFGGVLLAALTLTATAAFAQAQTPSFSGNAWVAIAIIAGLVVFIALLIGGVISVSRRGETATEGDGFPILEDEDDKPRRRRR